MQTYVSHLRKALPPGRLVTRPPGYTLHVERGELDLHRFERLVDEGRRGLAEGDAAGAAERLGEALALWRGPALGDVTEAAFAQAEAARLEELRLAALEEHLEADLALGRHASAVGELEALVAEHPLRERPRAQLMLALYRSGRQPEALAVFRDARAALAELGIEPGQALRDAQTAVLRQDPSLDLPTPERPPRAPDRSLLVVCFDDRRLDAVLELGEPLARRPPHELVLLVLADGAGDLTRASVAANEHKAALASRGLTVRAAAFTSPAFAPDVSRLVSDADASLVLADGHGRLSADGSLDLELAALLAKAPCDVALLSGAATEAAGEAPVLVPFGGAEHEWAAVELAAWLCGAEGRPLHLAGAAADPATDRRDASGLLARAALLVQQVTGVQTEPLIVAAGAGDVLQAATGARALVVGLPDEWRTRGLGPTRTALADRAPCPVLLVRGGPKPAGLAPAGSITRYTWTISAEA